MTEEVDITQLDLHTIMDYAKKYLQQRQENNNRQKKYYGKINKKPVIREKAKRKYYITKNIYHPEYNPDCLNEGKKFKRPVET